MKTYNNFIFENLWEGSRSIDEKEFLKLLEENCKEFDKDIVITKRLDFSDVDYLLINKLKEERKSSQRSNYYTLLINNLESFKDFPKREQICELYGYWLQSINFNYYIVIPFDNSKWGVCPKQDIWSVKFPKTAAGGGYSSGEGYYYELSDVHELFTEEGFRIRDDNWKNFIEDMKEASEDPELYKAFKNKWNSIFPNVVETDLFSFIENEFTPENLDFTLFDYKDLKLIQEKREIWTDTPCLYVRREIYNYMFELPDLEKYDR